MQESILTLCSRNRPGAKVSEGVCESARPDSRDKSRSRKLTAMRRCLARSRLGDHSDASAAARLGNRSFFC
jgi:hypothetical protein